MSWKAFSSVFTSKARRGWPLEATKNWKRSSTWKSEIKMSRSPESKVESNSDFRIESNSIYRRTMPCCGLPECPKCQTLSSVKLMKPYYETLAKGLKNNKKI